MKLLLIVLSVVLGMTLETQGVTEPAVYWTIGCVTGIIMGCVD